MKKTIVNLRKEKKLTQRELANELTKLSDLKFSPTSIALYELGMRTPSLKRVKVIAKYFDVAIEEIIFNNNCSKW